MLGARPLSLLLSLAAFAVGAEDVAPVALPSFVSGAPPAHLAPEEIDPELGWPILDEGGIPPELVEIARAVRDRPVGERMSAISEPLLNMPYLQDAVGEGVAPDIDPPARYDAFDCLTFVEEVLALALPADPTGASAVRRELRYAREAAPSYENRNHFMAAEWVPNNIANGYLVDITAQLGETFLLRKEVTAKTWSWWKARSLFALPDLRLPIGEYALSVLSLGAAADAIDRIPDGALILTVRQSRQYVPIVITHIGFKIPSESMPLMRHATKMGQRPRVRNDRLLWYLDHVRWYHRRPVAGVMVLMPQEIGPRRSAVIAGEEWAAHETELEERDAERNAEIAAEVERRLVMGDSGLVDEPAL